MVTTIWKQNVIEVCLHMMKEMEWRLTEIIFIYLMMNFYLDPTNPPKNQNNRPGQCNFIGAILLVLIQF